MQNDMIAPYFSVVIPLYNKADSIRATLLSALEQAVQPFEIIVVDDGSSDESAAIVENMAYPNIRLIRQSNQGVSVARNTGIAEARGSHVAFLDADDHWLPGYLGEIASLIEHFPKAGLYATAYRLSAGEGDFHSPSVVGALQGNVVGPIDYFYAATFGDQPIFTSSICIPKSVLAAVGGFRPGIRHAEDMDLWARVAVSHQVVYSPTPQVIYRTEAENRAMSRPPELSPWVFQEEFDRLVQGGVLDDARKDLIREHVARVNLYHARLNLFSKERRRLRRFIDQIDTSKLQRRKISYKLASYFPLTLMTLAIDLHALLKRHAAPMLNRLYNEP